MTKHLESDQREPIISRAKRRPTCPPTCPPKPEGRRRKRDARRRKGWPPERRARQAALIRGRRPWLRSTGPRTEADWTTVSRLPVICPVFLLLSACISPVVFESAWLMRRPIGGVQKNSENRANKLLKPRFIPHRQSLAERQTRRAASPDRFFGAEKVNWGIAALAETGRDS